MVTDIVHMHFTSTVLWERESMILFMLYVPSIFFGVMAGVESLRQIFASFEVKSYWLDWSWLLACPSYPVLPSTSAATPGSILGTSSLEPMVVVQEMLAVISWGRHPLSSALPLSRWWSWSLRRRNERRKQFVAVSFLYGNTGISTWQVSVIPRRNWPPHRPDYLQSSLFPSGL